MTLLGQVYLLRFFVDTEIPRPVFNFLFNKFGNDRIDLGIQLGTFLRRTRNNQWCPGFINKYRVHLVHHGKIQFALEFFGDAESHVVAQVIKTEFIVRAVGDVSSIGLALFIRRLVRDNDADRQPEETVDPAHPLRVTSRQVIVDRDDVHTLAAERIQVDGQRCHQRLAFTGSHF